MRTTETIRIDRATTVHDSGGLDKKMINPDQLTRVEPPGTLTRFEQARAAWTALVKGPLLRDQHAFHAVHPT